MCTRDAHLVFVLIELEDWIAFTITIGIKSILK